jgi:hypothetical protein
MARCKMMMDAYDLDNDRYREAQERAAGIKVKEKESISPPLRESDHWGMGSRKSKSTDSWFIEHHGVEELRDPDFKGFDQRLQAFFATWFPRDPVPAVLNFKVCACAPGTLS